MSSIRLLVLCVLLAAPIAMAQGPDVTLEVIGEQTAFQPGNDARLVIQVTLEPGWHVNAHVPKDEYLTPTTVSLALPEGAAASGMVYPEPVEHTLTGLPDTMLVYGGTFLIGAIVQLDGKLAPGEYPVTATLEYQACDDARCAAPEKRETAYTLRVTATSAATADPRPDVFNKMDFSKATLKKEAPTTPAPAQPVLESTSADWRVDLPAFKVAARQSGYMASAAFIDWLTDIEAGRANASFNQFAGMSLWAVALLTLAGGLLLNLTPCVLPMIPINIAIIGAGARAGSRARGFALGGAYGAGIALVYGVLGLLAAFAGTAFGSINASPVFNAFIALIFILMALAMFDLFNVDFTRFQTRIGVKRKEGGGYLTSALMGGVAALLAGACVGPVVISVVLLAQDLWAKGNPAGLALPFLLGVGMAAPWPLAGAGLSFLPKPGAWMTHVKHLFGVLIFIMAAWYAHETYVLVNEQYFVDEKAVEASAQALDESGWSHSLGDALAKARAENKPVLIDFWATWCKNCLAMNENTFKDDAVLKKLDGYIKVKFQAQDLKAPEVKEVMDALGAGGFGLPVYVVLRP